SLRLKVVAEGIESATQLKLLQHEGCDLGQGYFFGAPMAASALRDWLHDDAARQKQFRSGHSPRRVKAARGEWRAASGEKPVTAEPRAAGTKTLRVNRRPCCCDDT